MVSAGGALVSGARLALSSNFNPEVFWNETRRYGVTVVFYAGEMIRHLTNASPTPSERNNPLRLLAGSGMRRGLWTQAAERFGVGVLEFYASTEGNAVLANASGEKPGSLGHPLPGSTEMAIVAYDFEGNDFIKGADGKYRQCSANELGILITKVDTTHPLAAVGSDSPRRVHRGVFEPSDSWFITGDVVRRDFDGDYWFVDRLADMVTTIGGLIPTRDIEDILYEQEEIAFCAVHNLVSDPKALIATISLKENRKFDVEKVNAALEILPPSSRPIRFQIVSTMPMSDGFRPEKSLLRNSMSPTPIVATYTFDGKQWNTAAEVKKSS